MPYGDFVNREDVYGIIQKTLSQYFGTKVSIKSKFSRTNVRNTMFCFSKLGYIIPIPKNETLREYVKRDYRITNSFIRKTIMNVYLFFVFHFPNFFCEKKIVFDNCFVNSNIMIVPGNKKMKIIDFEKRTITNIVKSEFGKTWMKKEIDFRLRNKKKYVLPLTPTDFGYEEKLLHGYCFTRLTIHEQKMVQPVVSAILKDYRGKEKVVFANEYLGPLIERVKKSFSIIDDIEKENKDFLISLLDQIFSKVKYMPVTLCFSHGDLQKGNFFYDKDCDNIFLLDWETGGERTSWYDKFLFYYGFRNSTRFEKNVDDYIADLGEKVLEHKAERIDSIKVLLVFFVEDLYWLVGENSVLPKGCISNGIREYLKIDNLRKIHNLINEICL